MLMHARALRVRRIVPPHACCSRRSGASAAPRASWCRHTCAPHLRVHTSAAATPLFGSVGKSSGFSFGTGSFPAPKATPDATKNGGEGGEGGDGDGGNVEVFGESTAEFKAVVELPDSKVRRRGVAVARMPVVGGQKYGDSMCDNFSPWFYL